MAKPRTPNQKKAYSSLKSRLVQYSSLVDAIFDQLNKKAAQTLFVTTDYSASSGKPFSWSDYPLAKERVRQIQTSYVDSMTGLIYAGTSNEWRESNTIQDLLANSAFKAYHIDPDTKKYEHYYQDNSDALKAFNERREKGMNLSQRLWNQSEEYKNELECAISLGIQRGTNAVSLSTQLRQYLNDFPRLQREYKLKYSREPEVRNARYAAKRLAVTEINMAYRTAENKRWEQMDFVVGIEIKTSDEHFNRMPKGDVCDTLQGRYPKDFQWRGWHPNCLCYQIPILKTEDEFWADMDKEEPTTESENEVTEIPDNFEQWIEDNRERIETASVRGTLPYFIQDNQEIVTDILTQSEIPEEHRSPEQVADNTSPEINTIHEETEEEKQILQDADDILSLSEEYFDIDASTLQRLIETKDYVSIQQEAERLRNLYEDEKAKEARWLTLIPDAHKLLKQYPSAQLEEIYKYMNGIENSARDILDKKKDYERLYDDVKFSFVSAPPELLKSIYLDRIKDINNEAERTFISENINGISDWTIDHMQSTELDNMVYELREEIRNNGDIEHIKALYQDLIKELDKDIALSDVQTRRDEAVYDRGNGSEADKILRGGAGRNWFNASQRERDEVFDYTQHYRAVNTALRAGQFDDIADYNKANAITSYINREALPLDMWFQRGESRMDVVFSRIENNEMPLDTDIKNEIIDYFVKGDEDKCNSLLQSLEGKTMWEHGFLSTSSSKGRGFTNESIQLNIFAPRGTRASYAEPFSEYGDGARKDWDGLSKQNKFSKEDETIFQRGTKLKIIKATYSNGKIYIDCEVTGQVTRAIHISTH